MSIQLAIIAGYMALTLGISLYFAKKNRNSRQFFVADRGLGTFLIATFIFSGITAGAGTIGNAEVGFTTGLSSVWGSWSMVVGCVMFVFLVMKFYRVLSENKGTMSLPEAYEYLFDRRCRVVLLAVIALVYGILFSSQPVAAAAIIAPMLGVDPTWVCWGATAVFILITITGGMKGIAWMNVVHSAMMYIGMFTVCILAVRSAGGVEGIRTGVPPSYFSFALPSLMSVVAYALGTGFSYLASASTVNPTYSARNIRCASRGILLGAFLVLPFAFATSVIGICGQITMPGIAPRNALYAVANGLGDVYGGLISTTIIAAIWSSAPAFLLIVASTLTRDLYRGFLAPNSTDRQQMIFSRVIIVIAAVVFTAFGMEAKSILSQMLGAFQIRSVVGIVLAISIFWPRVTKDAAFWSMLTGGIVAAVWHFAGNPHGIAPLWPALAVLLGTLVPLTLRSREKESPGYRLYREAVAQLRSENKTEPLQLTDGKLSLSGK